MFDLRSFSDETVLKEHQVLIVLSASVNTLSTCVKRFMNTYFSISWTCYWICINLDLFISELTVLSLCTP